MASEGPSLKALSAFEATIRLGSMTAAARELGTSQPAVSQRIRHLEDTLGTPLIVRGVKHAVPNPAGRAYYDEIAGPLHRIQAATRSQMAEAAGQRRRVVIAANFGFAHLWLLPRLEALELRFPDTIFEILPIDGDSVYENGRADILIRFGSFAALGRHEFPLMEERVYPVGAPDLLARFDLAGRLDASALSEVPFLHMDTGDPRWLDWPRWCQLAGLPTPPPGRFFYRNYPLLIRAAADGAGVALVWAGLDQDLDTRLHRLRPVVDRPDWGYIASAGNHRSAVVGPMVAWLRQACQVADQSDAPVRSV
jgi:DNA-binding transcriptional LysR family regulator